MGIRYRLRVLKWYVECGVLESGIMERVAIWISYQEIVADNWCYVVGAVSLLVSGLGATVFWVLHACSTWAQGIGLASMHMKMIQHGLHASAAIKSWARWLSCMKTGFGCMLCMQVPIRLVFA